MPGVDWIPIVSQFKSVVQLITGDVESALRTQVNFAQECPGVSQVVYSVQLFAEDAEAQKKCLNTVNRVANRLPLLGHVKGVIHHLVGDHEGGNQALNTATLAIVILAANSFGTIYNEFDSDQQKVVDKIKTRFSAICEVNETNENDEEKTKNTFKNAVRVEGVIKLKNDLLLDEKNSSDVAEALDKQQLIHVKMPEHFEYTGAILTNDLSNGLLNCLVRDLRQWKNIRDSDLRTLIKQLPVGIFLVIKNFQNNKTSKVRLKSKFVHNLMNSNDAKSLELRRILLKMQMKLHDTMMRNITTDRFLGIGICNNSYHKFKSYFEVSYRKSKRVMVVCLSEDLHFPVDCFDDKRPVRTIKTAYFIKMRDFEKIELRFYNRNNNKNERSVGDAVNCGDHSDDVCVD